MEKQEEFLRQAIKISKENLQKGGGPFGAVIVKDGEIIAATGNSVTNTNDPTAHAEVNAIRMATKKLNTFDLSGCEIYSSCEPCPMCLGAIYWARIDKLYFAANKTDAKNIGFDDEFIYNEIDLPFEKRKLKTTQMLQKEAVSVFELWDKMENKTEY
jgi:tRNA(Arg) A34 adenosine deaminase TadA